MKVSTYVVFYGLAAAFWLLVRDFSELTLLCVFYSAFVGTVYGLVPKVSHSESLSWKFLLPPMMLILLMMFSVRLKMMMSAEVVLITSMALVHFRASVMSFSRLRNKAKIFSWLQLASFVFGMFYLFHKSLISYMIPRMTFLMTMMGLSVVSMMVLIVENKKIMKNISDEVKSKENDS